MIIHWLWHFIWFLNGLVLFYFIALNSVYLITSIISIWSLKQYSRQLKSVDVEDLLSTAGAPPITLIAPAFNEEATCVESVRSLLTLQYPDYEILFVNDGSKDQTLERMLEAYDMHPAARFPTSSIPTMPIQTIYRSRRYPHLYLLDKKNGGKADALNAGINYCRTPLFCAMDADTLLERDALIRVVRPFLESDKTVAVGGIIRIVNDCTVRAGLVTHIKMPRNWIAKFQVLEYLRAFLAGRMGWGVFQSTLIISGAFGLFRRSTVVGAGGYSTKLTSRPTVGEDMELVVRLHRYCRQNKIPYKIQYIPDPVAWTECPESLAVLGRQRTRWQRGLTEVLFRHIGMLFNPRYGRIGMVVFPYFFFLEMLGSLIELAGYIAFILTVLLANVSSLFVVAFLTVAFVLGTVLSLISIALEELTFRRYPRFQDMLQLFGLCFLESFGYRQIQSYWRVKGVFQALMRNQEWGRMDRKGFQKEPLSAASDPAALSTEKPSLS